MSNNGSGSIDDYGRDNSTGAEPAEQAAAGMLHARSDSYCSLHLTSLVSLNRTVVVKIRI